MDTVLTLLPQRATQPNQSISLRTYFAYTVLECVVARNLQVGADRRLEQTGGWAIWSDDHRFLLFFSLINTVNDVFYTTKECDSNKFSLGTCAHEYYRNNAQLSTVTDNLRFRSAESSLPSYMMDDRRSLGSMRTHGWWASSRKMRCPGDGGYVATVVGSSRPFY